MPKENSDDSPAADAGESIIEDISPPKSNGDLVDLDTIPSHRKPYRVHGTHDQETRKNLAKVILWPLVLLYASIIVCFLCGVLNTEQLTAAMAAMTGLQVLAAAAIGFYFGSKN